MSSVAWLEVNMFIKAYGPHSLTKQSKSIMQEDNNCDDYAVNDQKNYINIQKDAHIKKYQG